MILTGTNGVDNLVGGSSSDRISGLGGNDTLTGGLGNDYLDGGLGADTYNFRQGDGQDTLDDNGNDIGLDTLVFSGAALTSTNVIVTRVGTRTDLRLSFRGSTDSVVLDGQLFGGLSANFGVERITFSDGVTWNEAQLWNAYLTLGADTNDTLVGTTNTDTIIGGKGSDYLDGGLGADTYNFRQGDGQDILDDNGNDIGLDALMFSGAGLTSTNVVVTRVGTRTDLKLSFRGSTDSVVLDGQLFGGLSANFGVERITFSDGVTWNEAQLWNAYLTLGADTNDTLVGTNSADTIVGGKGTDYLDGGLGADTYSFRQGDGQDTLDDNGNDIGLDTLVFSGAALTSTNVIVTRVGTRTDLKLSFRGSTDSVVLDGQLFGGLSANFGVERIAFSNGVTWNEAQLWNAYLTLGADTNDTLVGTNSADTIVGGKGSDYLDGGSGADTYSFRQGDGQDILDDNGNDAGLDTLVFSGAALTSTNVVVTRVGTRNDLRLSFQGSTDSVVLDGQLFGGLSANFGVERITFSNGVTWNETQLRNAIQGV